MAASWQPRSGPPDGGPISCEAWLAGRADFAQRRSWGCPEPNSKYTWWSAGAANARLRAMSLRAILARNLRQLRQAKGWSQEEIAARADITANYVSSLEREEYAATVDVIEALAAALDVEATALLQK